MSSAPVSNTAAPAAKDVSVSRRRERIDAHLERLSDHLASDLGDSLVSVVLYGPFARSPTYDSRTAPVNVLILVADVDLQILTRASAAIQQADRKINLATMIMSVDELQASTDVFPIKFLDMQQCHCLLRGEDVLSRLEIALDHLRLRCEQELKNILLRLQNLFVHRRRHTRQLRSALVTAISAFLVAARAALYLRDEQLPQSDLEVIEATSQTFELNFDVLQQATKLRDAEFRPDRQSLEVLYGAFLLIVHKMACAMDEHSTMPEFCEEDQ